jgi:sugar phosphate isomerase/epimerase
MWLDTERRLGHLTYCTNIHAGEGWDDVMASLRNNVPAIKQSLELGSDIGIGLRVGGAASEALKQPAAIEELKSFLQDTGAIIVTFNGFPYGAFHGQTVKEDVYRPDWADPVRLNYTNDLADTMASVLPEGEAGSISTVPGTFKPWASGNEETIARNMISHVGHLVQLHRDTGKEIALALEPEPCCMLETIEESIDFFASHIFSATGVAQLASETGLSNADAEAALRRHIGVCYDVCHAAVEYEDPRASVAALRSAGIAIPKLQLSSALRLAEVDEAKLAALRGFDEPVYLHQVIEKSPSGLVRHKDLNEAFATAEAAMGREWRVHFHVPIFLERLEQFDTTQAFLREILALHREEPISPHLEVETYTWDVLPEQYRNVSVSAAIAREMNWVREQLVS